MTKSATVVLLASSLTLTACAHNSDYRVEGTWRCLVKKGLEVSVQSGPALLPGIDASISFERFVRDPRSKAVSGWFVFVLKRDRIDEVRRRLIRQGNRSLGPSPPKVGKPQRNVIPEWSDTADVNFKATAAACLQ